MNGETVSSPPATRRLDQRVWAVATWSIPFVIQLVTGAVLIAMWLIGKWTPLQPNTSAETRSTLLIGIGIAVVIFLAVAAALVTRPSSTTRGVGLGTAASAAIILIGGVVYAFWIF
jgi:hypothetical protein